MLLLGALIGVACFLAGFYARPHLLKARTPSEAVGVKTCDVCGERLPVTAIRTSNGAWRCRVHKGAA